MLRISRCHHSEGVSTSCSRNFRRKVQSQFRSILNQSNTAARIGLKHQEGIQGGLMSKVAANVATYARACDKARIGFAVFLFADFRQDYAVADDLDQLTPLGAFSGVEALAQKNNPCRNGSSRGWPKGPIGEFLRSRTAAITQALRNFARIGIVPTVLRLDGLRIVIYPNDHRPAHVHVIGSSREAVLNLNCPAGPVDLRENYGFPRREIGRAGAGLMDHLDELCRSWEQIHGVA